MKIISYKLENSKGEIEEIVPLEKNGYRQQQHFEYNILKWIDSDEITEYAEQHLGMMDENECESDITDFTINELKERLGEFGFEVDYISEEIDNVDSDILNEIASIFYAANWEERKQMLEKLKS